MPLTFAEPTAEAIPIRFVTRATWATEEAALSGAARAFAKASGFEPKPGRMLLVPGDNGAISRVLFALDEAEARAADPFLPGELATRLPRSAYRFANEPHDTALAALAFLLASYRFGKYKHSKNESPRLVAPEGVDGRQIERIAAAVALGRDRAAGARTSGRRACRETWQKMQDRTRRRFACAEFSVDPRSRPRGR
jgi:leucyl aminopeptidase